MTTIQFPSPNLPLPLRPAPPAAAAAAAPKAAAPALVAAPALGAGSTVQPTWQPTWGVTYVAAISGMGMMVTICYNMLQSIGTHGVILNFESESLEYGWFVSYIGQHA